MRALWCCVVLGLLLPAAAWAEEHDKAAAFGFQVSKQSRLDGAQLTLECTPEGLPFRKRERREAGVHPKPEKHFAFVLDASYHSGEHDGLTRDQYLLMGGGRLAFGISPRNVNAMTARQKYVQGTNRAVFFVQVLVGYGWSVDHGVTENGRPQDEGVAFGAATGLEVNLTRWLGLRFQGGLTVVDDIKPIPRFGVSFVYRYDEE